MLVWRIPVCLLVLTISLAARSAAPPAAALAVVELQCEGLSNPIGIDIAAPRLSWKLQSSRRGCMQLAYQIIVSSTEENCIAGRGDVWNSGKRMSDLSDLVPYGGKTLLANHVYYWKVYIWARGDQAPARSRVASWSTGLMKADDWKAKWIGLDSAFAWDLPTAFHSRLSARYFRKEWVLNKSVKRATVFIAGLGMYELYMNGARIGHQVLSPSVTDFSKRVYSNAFDVTRALSSDRNTIGVVLGNGRFFSTRPGEIKKWKEEIPTITNFGYPKLLLQLEVEYRDGSSQTFVSDGSWKVSADGPIRSNNEYDGETYDANKEMKGWNRNAYHEAGWLPVDLTSAPGGKVCAQPNPNMEIMRVLQPRSVTKTRQGSYIVDMGQNIAGWVSLTMKGKKGDTVKCRFAEKLNDSGALYTANLRHAEVTDRYILKGGAEGEAWQPSFVYHGFQFVEISGPDALGLSDVEGKLIYDRMDNTGHFGSSDTTLNQIYQNAWWTIASNYKGIPVDCPQRDERMGWLGDRSVNCIGESFLFGNARIYAKWLDDIRDSQLENGSIPDVVPSFWWRFFSDNMTWPSTYLFVADMLYRQFGDRDVIRDHYPAMKKWMNHMAGYLTKELVMTKDSYGDWCMPPESKELIFSKDPTRKTPGDYLATTYYYKCLTMMAEFARIADMNDDAAGFTATAERVKRVVNTTFFNKGGQYYANNTTTANLLALSFGLAPMESRTAIAANIAGTIREKFDNHLSTGLVGNQWLMRGLTHNGYPDLAYTIATNRTYPSWGYMIDNGATTIWELWNGNTANPAMNSGNHVMLLGDLLIWYFEDLAGIRSMAPGFKRIEMKPLFTAPPDRVSADHQSPYGMIASSWKKNGKEIRWDIAIPANSSALVYIPVKDRGRIRIDGKRAANGPGIRFAESPKEYTILELGSGKYRVDF